MDSGLPSTRKLWIGVPYVAKTDTSAINVPGPSGVVESILIHGRIFHTRKISNHR